MLAVRRETAEPKEGFRDATATPVSLSMTIPRGKVLPRGAGATGLRRALPLCTSHISMEEYAGRETDNGRVEEVLSSSPRRRSMEVKDSLVGGKKEEEVVESSGTDVGRLERCAVETGGRCARGTEKEPPPRSSGDILLEAVVGPSSLWEGRTMSKEDKTALVFCRPSRCGDTVWEWEGTYHASSTPSLSAVAGRGNSSAFEDDRNGAASAEIREGRQDCGRSVGPQREALASGWSVEKGKEGGVDIGRAVQGRKSLCKRDESIAFVVVMPSVVRFLVFLSFATGDRSISYAREGTAVLVRSVFLRWPSAGLNSIGDGFAVAPEAANEKDGEHTPMEPSCRNSLHLPLSPLS